MPGRERFGKWHSFRDCDAAAGIVEGVASHHRAATDNRHGADLFGAPPVPCALLFGGLRHALRDGQPAKSLRQDRCECLFGYQGQLW